MPTQKPKYISEKAQHHVTMYGKYYCPAKIFFNKEKNNANISVECDKCFRQDLTACLGYLYDDVKYTLCITCVIKIIHFDLKYLASDILNKIIKKKAYHENLNNKKADTVLTLMCGDIYNNKEKEDVEKKEKSEAIDKKINDFKNMSQHEKFSTVCKNGIFVYPANVYKGATVQIITCDKCKKPQLEACLTFNNMDLCLECVNQIINTSQFEDFRYIPSKREIDNATTLMCCSFYDIESELHVNDDVNIVEPVLEQNVANPLIENLDDETCLAFMVLDMYD